MGLASSGSVNRRSGERASCVMGWADGLSRCVNQWVSKCVVTVFTEVTSTLGSSLLVIVVAAWWR